MHYVTLKSLLIYLVQSTHQTHEIDALIPIFKIRKASSEIHGISPCHPASKRRCKDPNQVCLLQSSSASYSDLEIPCQASNSSMHLLELNLTCLTCENTGCCHCWLRCWSILWIHHWEFKALWEACWGKRLFSRQFSFGSNLFVKLLWHLLICRFACLPGSKINMII